VEETGISLLLDNSAMLGPRLLDYLFERNSVSAIW